MFQIPLLPFFAVLRARTQNLFGVEVTVSTGVESDQRLVCLMIIVIVILSGTSLACISTLGKIDAVLSDRRNGTPKIVVWCDDGADACACSRYHEVGAKGEELHKLLQMKRGKEGISASCPPWALSGA